MASSALTYSRRYHVFPSFHGPDVRRTFLSHLHKYFTINGIMAFKDKEMERGHMIGPMLEQAIRESRVSIVVLSKNYASSSWCLDELVEILKCKEDMGQIVMTVFSDVDPSHVRKQSGDFGTAFEKTCQGQTVKKKQGWSKALTYVADIAGEHYLNWDDEGDMIQKIAADVSNKLNVTLSKDFEGMVGMEAHLRKLDSLLCLECDDVKMIGVWGPAGIGKTTIARALYNKISTGFPLSCFMGNLRGGSCRSIMGVDDNDSKLCLQSQLLSKILNQNNIKIHHLGAIEEWLQDQRALVILDDVDDVEQLEVLAKEPSWFGLGSRIIVTTEDQKILKAHGIKDTYHVDFPSDKEALEILYLSAFKQPSPQDGFGELAKKVARLCGNLPLGLRVVGSSLRGDTKAEWELQLSGIETSLDRKLGRQEVVEQSYDPGKRQFLIEAQDILNVLVNETGTGSVKGISLDMSKTGDLVISGRAFEKLRNLQFLRVHSTYANVSLVHIHGDMEYLPRLKLLRWDSYQGALLPPTFRSECLIELHMPSSKLEKLWGGIQPLANLKKLNLDFSYKLKEIPNLSKATNLETLTLIRCTRLVEFPSFILDLQKLETLRLWGCKKLQVVPMNINSSASPADVRRSYCSGIRNFPDISMNIYGGGTEIEEVPPLSDLHRYRIPWADVGDRDHKRESIRDLNLSYRDIEKIPSYARGLDGLHTLIIKNCRKLASVAGLPSSIKYIHADNCVSLERVTFPLVRLQDPIKELIFHNCLRLGEESRRAIIQHRVARYICLPGIKIPAEFTHIATGNRISISPGTFFASWRFKACLLLSPINDHGQLHVTCFLRSKGDALVNEINYIHLTSDQSPQILMEHLFIFRGDLIGHQNKRSSQVDVTTSEMILFEFQCGSKYKIVACGVRILSGEDENRITELDESISNYNSDEDGEYNKAEEEEEEAKDSQSENIKISTRGFIPRRKKSRCTTACWRWPLKLLFCRIRRRRITSKRSSSAQKHTSKLTEFSTPEDLNTWVRKKQVPTMRQVSSELCLRQAPCGFV